MASNPPGKCCMTGFKHEGKPDGEIKNIGGVPTYFAYPTKTEFPEKAIIILSDIIGIYNNSQLLADDYANHGYLTVIPDLFHGEAVKLNEFESGLTDLHAWIQNHTPSIVEPVVEMTIKHLREKLGIKKIGGVGYCFGGKYVARFLRDGGLNVGYTAHPSHITDEELGAIKGPLSISAAEIDQIFPSELRHKSEDILIKVGQPWQINLFSGVSHGFAVRGDLDNPQVKYAKEQAFLQAVSWFKEYL